MIQALLSLLKEFFSSIISISNTTKELVPTIEKRQELREEVVKEEAENDVIRKDIKEIKLINKKLEVTENMIRKDLKDGWSRFDIIQYYRGQTGIDYSDVVNKIAEELKEKRPKKYKNI